MFSKKKTEPETPEVKVTTDYTRVSNDMEACIHQENGAYQHIRFKRLNTYSAFDSVQLSMEHLDDLEQLIKWAKEMRDGTKPEAAQSNSVDS